MAEFPKFSHNRNDRPSHDAFGRFPFRPPDAPNFDLGVSAVRENARQSAISSALVIGWVWAVSVDSRIGNADH